MEYDKRKHARKAKNKKTHYSKLINRGMDTT